MSLARGGTRGRLTGLWFLPKPAFGLNTNDDDDDIYIYIYIHTHKHVSTTMETVNYGVVQA